MEGDLEGLVKPARYPQEETEAEAEARVPAPVEERDEEEVELRLPEQREEPCRRLEPCRACLERLNEGDLNIRHTAPAFPPRSTPASNWGIASAIPVMMNWIAIARTMTAINFGTTRNPPSPMKPKIRGP